METTIIENIKNNIKTKYILMGICKCCGYPFGIKEVHDIHNSKSLYINIECFAVNNFTRNLDCCILDESKPMDKKECAKKECLLKKMENFEAIQKEQIDYGFEYLLKKLKSDCYIYYIINFNSKLSVGVVNKLIEINNQKKLRIHFQQVEDSNYIFHFWNFSNEILSNVNPFPFLVVFS